jgi:hypothetical protein
MFFTKDNFFRGLRLILALDQDKVMLREVLVDVIERGKIPELQTKKAREPDEGKKEELQKEIDIWKTYADRNSSQSRSWANDLTAQIGAIGNSYGFSESNKEEMAQDIVGKFYLRPNLRNKLIKSEGGPTGLLKLFKTIVRGEAKNFHRKLRSEQRTDGVKGLRPTDVALHDDGGVLIRDVADRAESELDRQMIREVKRDMSKWVNSKIRKPWRKMLDLTRLI